MGRNLAKQLRKRAESRYQKEGKCQLRQSTNAQVYCVVTGTLEPSGEIEKGWAVRDGTMGWKVAQGNTRVTQSCGIIRCSLLTGLFGGWGAGGGTRDKQKELELDPVGGSCQGNPAGLEGRAHARDLSFIMYRCC